MNVMNVMNETMLFSLNPDISYTQIDDEAVLLGVVDEKLYGLNSMGAEILQQFAVQPMSIQTLLNYLLTHFETDEKQCLADIRQFLEALLAEQIILPTA